MQGSGNEIGQPPRAGLIGVCIGNTLAWYDAVIFSIFAVQISRVIFPAGDPAVTLMQTLGLVGVSYLARPVGALVLGRMGDRVGRKPALLLAFTLAGVSVAGQALVPSYAVIGLAAPAAMLLLRLLLGFALGGEMGPATAYMIEAAPDRRRGLFVSLQLSASDAGTLLAGLVATVLAWWLTEPQLEQWGWRIALLLGAAIVPYGLFLRRRLHETLPAAPGQERASLPKNSFKLPVAVILVVLCATFVALGIKYLSIYAQTTLGMPAALAFSATIVISAVAILFTTLGGIVSDRVGQRVLVLLSLTVIAITLLPAFQLLNSGRDLTVLLLISAWLAGWLAFASAPMIAALALAIPQGRRATAVGLIAAMTVALVSSTADVLITWLIHISGNPLAPAWAMTAAALGGLLASLAVRWNSAAAEDPPTQETRLPPHVPSALPKHPSHENGGTQPA